MSIFKEFDYNEKSIRKIITDENGGNFLWMAFNKDTDNTCTLKKVSSNDPSQTYFKLSIEVNDISTMITSGDYILLAVSHDDYYIYKYQIFNPHATPTKITIPSGINENVIDVVEGDGSFWWLFPGSLTGENAKIVKTSLSGIFSEIIDLQETGSMILNASSLTHDGTDLWITTYTNPAELWRVYFATGGWEFDRVI